MSHCIPFAAALILAVTACGQEAKWPPASRQDIARAVADGKKFLIEKQVEVAETNPPQGHWDVEPISKKGGSTALVLLALQHAGEKPDADVIQRGLRYLRTVEPNDTYIVGLQTAVFARAGLAEDRALIQRNVDWLIASQVSKDGKLEGWGYRKVASSADNSNTQYALIGLAAGRQSGARIDPKEWSAIQHLYLDKQDPTGGWYYMSEFKTPTMTMTTAGLNGLLISGESLAAIGQKLDERTGVTTNCGVRKENAAANKAVDWIGKDFAIQTPATFYNLYGLERAGRQSGLRYFGSRDWRLEGCEYLVKNQRVNGSWHLPRAFDSFPVVSTSFALLFLKGAETPVLLTKLVHGEEDGLGGDWNRKPHELRNLAKYAAKEIYQQPDLGWQVINARQTGKNPEELLRDLKPCPLVYLSGHQAPTINGAEEKLLLRYLEQGGTLLAEACCGSKEFDKGFRALMNRLYPDKLLRLKPDHPVWKAHTEVAADTIELWGIEQGGRIIVFYSPQPLSGYWEANRHEAGRGRLAFQLAGNIIRYAAGKEFPKKP